MRIRNDQREVWVILVLAGLAGWCGCSTTVPSPRMPEPAPPVIRVDSEELPAVAFAEVLLEIPDHLAIGYHYEGLDNSRVTEYRWGKHFREARPALDDDCRAVLDGAGYRLDAADPQAVKLVARMVRVSFDSYAYKSSYKQATCEMMWELYRTGDAKPYFLRTTTGAGRAEGANEGAILAAFHVALHKLLADGEFVAAVRASGEK